MTYTKLAGCAYSQLKSALEDALSAYLDRFTGLGRRLDRRKAAANSWNVMQHSLTLNQARLELCHTTKQLTEKRHFGIDHW